MIQLDNIPLSSYAKRHLVKNHKKVMSKKTFEEKIKEGSRVWNFKNNKAFKEIKTNLTKMCSGHQRCCYCEDAPAYEIEHIAPKNIYPELCFTWENYLYACGPCNGPKSNNYALFLKSNGSFKDITPQKGKYPIPPKGTPVLIDPRKENPFDYIILDFKTFRFTPFSPDKKSKEYKRGEYTIDILNLNTRDYLVKRRAASYKNFTLRLQEYIKQKNEGKTAKQLAILTTGIKEEHNITIFKEMQRQHIDFESFNEIFSQIPEALTW